MSRPAPGLEPEDELELVLLSIDLRLFMLGSSSLEVDLPACKETAAPADLMMKEPFRNPPPLAKGAAAE